ncbi:ABC transporter substrate-binding protein [Methylobacterium gnaphalii]|uniref:ABC transporter substrate-binding protein n=1 Tax=Methylobacterium gnaphalii TaxID=1010610 RepID=A0A512JQB7_9HYPH|nr:ABC transporter substrate-binding protein [Methylobacterium gnaphalii]GEP12156.1 ABC transporter substrate-binding protein [Methylobacterium gnaphalii]GJD70021.1 Periplasmic dipeptide transport protein [Methylobacterium gnaphalii]GLS48915.1 ABC transporter substrate-binding protein [Methylobacterium gnaphalii]
MRLHIPALTALFATALLAAWPASARTLVFCSEGAPETLDPALATTTTTMNATWQMFNTLVEFEAGTTVIRPALAESWTVSEDGRTYVFTLRDDVQFHSNSRFEPSRALEAEDVVFSFIRQWRPDHPFHRGARFAYFHDLGLADALEGIDKLDARRVRFRLKAADTTFLANLAQAFASIESAEYAERLASANAYDEFTTAPIGTGPFEFVDHQPNIALRYRPFLSYWRRHEARAGVDGLVFSITPNAAVRLAKLRSGECHVMAFPATANLPAISGDPDLAVLSRAELNVAYLAFNTSRPPFDDPRVRRAINMAIDKQVLIRAIYGPDGTTAKGPLPPDLWSYDGSLPDVPFNRTQALALLAEAGLPNGFETELWYLPVSRPYNPNGQRMASMIQADLARIGVRVRLATREWGAYRTAIYEGVPSAMLYGWTSDNGDPDNFLNVLLGCKAAQPGGANLARWCDRAYDDLVQKARRQTDRDLRTDLYRQAQAIFASQLPWVPLAHSIVYMATRREVVGFQMDPLGRHLFEGVRLRD